jgi:hypothetical protein
MTPKPSDGRQKIPPTLETSPHTAEKDILKEMGTRKDHYLF